MIDGQMLGDHAAHRDADDMRAGYAQHVEQAHRVVDEIRERVRRRAGRVAGRASGVAMVVADDEPQPSRQLRAELVRPPVHRAGRAADKQDRRIASVAECLDAQLHAVGMHQPVVHRRHSATAQ